ncbi:MAG: EamA family transporter [Actinomycetota bacterium]|nr:EamA family transporter [Actinomycetota bacterium]
MGLSELMEQKTAPRWLIWVALWTVYVIWGSTYLAIRVMVRTLPPLLSGGARFVVAGAVLLGVLLVRRGVAAVTIGRRELLSSSVIGAALLLGGNGLVSVAEEHVPSGLAALLIASVPLWVVLLRSLFEGRVPFATLLSVAVGFAGVAILVVPGGRSSGAPVGGLLLLLVAAVCWAGGSFLSTKLSLPRDPLVSTGFQMLCGGIVMLVVGLMTGEGSTFTISGLSRASVLAFAYLVVAGSLVAFTAYSWLLRNAPISKVATYAYVNPLVAILLGWSILHERVTPAVLLGAAVILSSVAFVIRKESHPEHQPEAPEVATALAAVDTS